MDSNRSVVRSDDALLVVIDIQERLAAAMHRRDAVVGASRKLVATAALVGMGIVVTRQYPRGLGELDATVEDSLMAAESGGARVSRIDKVAFDCFADPAFAETVAGSGRHQLVLAGMESHICIAQTALGALERGHEVHVVSDACCSREPDAHAVAMGRLGLAGVVVTTWESVAYEAVGAAGTDRFRALLEIVKA